MGIFYHPLDTVLSSVAKLRVLRILAVSRGPLSGREITGLAGIALLSAQRALRDLAAVGVVVQEETRSQHLYTLNREHALVRGALEPLFTAEELRVPEVFATIREWLPDEVCGAYLFGSAARGADEPGSDFDLLVVAKPGADTETLRGAIEDEAPAFFDRFGLRLSTVVLDSHTLLQMHQDGDPFAAAVLAESRRIAGPHLDEVLGW